MALGVLNNISAIYAENNLNQTQSSLQNTLQQLSSGSRINSGADDAAGLSIANGLEANSSALTQSSSNASAGVGFLQVADGALSQVTNLLNRAVTLATEAGGGTLSSSQLNAADQEYQDILNQITNIGATTQYNGIATFGSETAGAASTPAFSAAGGALGAGLGASATMTLTTGDSLSGQITVASTGLTGHTGTVTLSLANYAGLSSTNTNLQATAVANLQAALNAGSGSLSTATGSTYSVTETAGAVKIKTNDATGAEVLTIASAASPNAATQTAAGTGAVNIFTSDGTTNGSTAYDVTVGVLNTGSVGTTSGGGGGQSLTGSSLTSQANAETSLTKITTAIADVAYQRGQVGANINTLTAASNIANSEETNVSSAENSITATDYASATSNMSKYEILTQTGISALAQANSTQQMVTKLLQ
jgi:flagellin